MDDAQPAVTSQPYNTCSGGLAPSRCLWMLSAALLVSNLSGCSLFVMAGKLFYGDPKMTSAYHNATGIDLAKDDKKVLVIFSTPESVKSRYASIEFDLTEQTIRQLKRRGIKVIDPDDVATFIDDNGGHWHDESDLARHFDADVIVHIDLESFTCTEDNSPWALRGRAAGHVYGYRVVESGGEKYAKENFSREFTSTHPQQAPVSTDNISREAFQKRYVDLIASQVGQMLYDFRVSELIQ